MTAPDQLEPYTVTLSLEPRVRIASPADLVAHLLEDVARRCEEAGCSVIGHIKCHARTADRAFSCSLTSRRSGAACREAVHGPLLAGGVLRVDLAVLVYGLPWAKTRAAVNDALSASLPHSSGDWLAAGECTPHDHVH